MNHPPEYYASKPNLLRVAQEIAKMDHPGRVVNVLFQVLAGHAETEPPAPLPASQTNNERFNAILNSCQHPRAIYNALYALAPGYPQSPR